MSSFPLKIVTADGLIYDGPAERLTVRACTGDLTVLARHADCVVALGAGRATAVIHGQPHHAACIGGMLCVMHASAVLLPTTFEWAQSIDLSRAEASRQRAEAVLRNPDASEADIRLAKARLRRALVRQNVAANS